MITLGPLLVGASFSLTTYLFIASEWLGLDVLVGPFGWVGRFAPTVLIIVGMGTFFMVIPNRHVPLRVALVGGIVGGILFSLLRKVFGWYVSTFPTYQNVYGALSVVPIFLIWMYMSWSVVLLGAVITTTLGEWLQAGGRHPSRGMTGAGRLNDALAVLATMVRASRTGEVTRRSQLLRQTAMAEDRAERTLEVLQNEGFVQLTADDGWVLSRDLSRTTLFELFDALSLAPSLLREGTTGISDYIFQARKCIQQNMDIPLLGLLIQTEEEQEHLSDRP